MRNGYWYDRHIPSNHPFWDRRSKIDGWRNISSPCYDGLGTMCCNTVSPQSWSFVLPINEAGKTDWRAIPVSRCRQGPTRGNQRELAKVYFISDLQLYFSRGGEVLYIILGLSIWLNWLIMDRYFFFFKIQPERSNKAISTWERTDDKTSWLATVTSQRLISEVEVDMISNLRLIPVIIALLPLVGLLGTVTGMIQVFEVMAFLGSGNPRAMASGVSAATIPTMSGMVVALFAIPFSTQLNRKYQSEIRRLKNTIKPGA